LAGDTATTLNLRVAPATLAAHSPVRVAASEEEVPFGPGAAALRASLTARMAPSFQAVTLPRGVVRPV